MSTSEACRGLRSPPPAASKVEESVPFASAGMEQLNKEDVAEWGKTVAAEIAGRASGWKSSPHRHPLASPGARVSTAGAGRRRLPSRGRCPLFTPSATPAFTTIPPRVALR